MRKILALIAGFLATASLFTSCLETEDVVLSGNAYIVSFSINNIETEVPVKTADGKDTTLVETVYGDNYTFAIDHVAGEVYNVDSLPKGTDVTRVSVNMSVDGGYVYCYQNGENKLFSTEDSVDFSTPVLFTVYPYNDEDGRSYYIRLNVAQTEGDSLVWTSVENNTSHAGRMTIEKMVQHRDYLIAFGEMDGMPTRIYGQLGGSFKFSGKEFLLKGVAGTVDYSSIVSHEMALYLLADGKLYSSLTGVEWNAESHDRTFTSMVGIVNGKLCLNEGGKIVVCDPYEWSTDNRVEQFTHDWEEIQTVDEDLFPMSPSVVEVPLKTNPNIVRTTLLGYPRNYAEDGVSMWVKLSTDTMWTYYNPIAGNGNTCPALERLTVLAYGNKLYAFGGASKDGSVGAFEAIYTSVDGGLTWWKQKKKMGFPEELKGYNDPYACVMDTEGTIWIACSNGLVFKGRIGG
ncbi:MAG: hypothetical protein IKJ42_09990 [Bacteroidaceae bacterium]|nr:hypothetical protein [Bacteroidaceae bacterium]